MLGPGQPVAARPFDEPIAGVAEAEPGVAVAHDDVRRIVNRPQVRLPDGNRSGLPRAARIRRTQEDWPGQAAAGEKVLKAKKVAENIVEVLKNSAVEVRAHSGAGEASVSVRGKPRASLTAGDYFGEIAFHSTAQ